MLNFVLEDGVPLTCWQEKTMTSLRYKDLHRLSSYQCHMGLLVQLYGCVYWLGKVLPMIGYDSVLNEPNEKSVLFLLTLIAKQLTEVM